MLLCVLPSGQLVAEHGDRGEVIDLMIALETKSAKDEVAEAKAFKKDLE